MERPARETPDDAPVATEVRLPTGTVTFLFTDIEGSTRLLLRLGPDYPLVLQQHRDLLREVFTACEGAEVSTEGDSFFVAFARASDAAAAALEGQRRLHAYAWPPDAPVRVRMGLHTGEVAYSPDGGYTGLPVHEAARIAGAAHGGQVLMSQLARDLIAGSLPEGAWLLDLGPHRLKDLPLPQRLFQLCHPDLPESFPPVRSLGAADRVVPAQPTPLIGRDDEVAAIERRLRDPSVRLLTLSGPGGIGKSRLAVEVAGRLAGHFRDGVAFVPLASVQHPLLVLSGIGRALGVKEVSARSMRDTVAAALTGRQLLLVLDNFEQVLDAADDLAHLLAAAPEVTALVTSRSVLNLRGEVNHEVPPLEVPPDRGRVSPGGIAACGAVQLFVDRARAARSDFALDEHNAPDVAAICRRLDGLPLAIELAAARIKILPPRALARRLGDALALLTSGSRDLPDRQQTLRRTIDWSYQLLGPGERRLLAELAVFIESRTLEAIEAVCGSDDDLLDRLRSLVDKSFLRQQDTEEGEANFTMLSVIRSYALERLAESGRRDELCARHAAYYVELCRRAQGRARGPDQVHWIEVLEREHANLGAAMAWTYEQRDAPALLEILRCVHPVWWARAHVGEGLRWAEALCDLADELTPAQRAEARWIAGAFARAVGATDRSLELNRAGLDDARAAGDRRLEATIHKELGNLALNEGHGDEAERHYRLSSDIFRALDDELGLSQALNNLGVALTLRGRWRDALPLLHEALRLCERAEDQQGVARLLLNIGVAEREAGDYDAATRVIARSLRLWHELGGVWDIVDCLADLAAVAVAQGRHERAARLMGATDSLRRSINTPPASYEEDTVAAATRAARSALGPERFVDLWERGEAMSLEETLAFALEEG